MSAVETVALILSPGQAEAAVNQLDERQYAKLALFAGEIAEVKAEIEPLLCRPLESVFQAHQLNDLLGRAAKAGKELEDLRKARVQPLNDEVRNVNALFKTVTDALGSMRATGDRLLAAWNQQERARVAREKEEARRREEEAALKEAEALAKAEAATSQAARTAALAEAEVASREQTAAQLAAPLFEAASGFKSEHATSTSREVWVFQVVKPEDVPREYLCPDERKIAAAVEGGVRQIPGVAITQEERFTRRTR